MTSLLDVRGIAKRFGRTSALRDVTFRVETGEVLGLIGPNGAGKTTLFECLAGLRAADGGRVSVFDAAGVERVLAVHERTSVMAYVPDGIAPWPEQPAAWTLACYAALHEPGSRWTMTVDEARARLRLAPFIGQPMATLSKGERKRTLLAFALVTQQPVLLLDEPFDGLDLRQTRDVIAVLREAASRGRTLVLSIHQLGDALKVCDRLVLLSDGRAVGEGTIAELRARTGLADAGLEELFLALT